MTDSGIILFGKKIGLPERYKITNLPLEERENRHDERTLFTPHDQQGNPDDDNPKTPSIDEEGASENPQTSEIDGDLQPKSLKKPDKILPCPRCESMNTKFCYYNNSNVNQPRHFCKSCQRYWTAGGTMRNMPVGAGRRKKKNPPPDYRLIISQETFESPKVLSFGPNSPHFGGDNREDCSSESTVITSNSVTEKTQENNNGFHSQVHWIPGTPWSYNPWNSMPVYPPGYPIYPSPYWTSVSWLPPNYSILGKHLRDGKSIKPNEESKKQKNSVLIPKTLRIDDPDEAAKSSIWATLGIKNENSGKGHLFKAFQPKRDENKKHKSTEDCPALQANPAAFSRSLRFQERA